MISNIKNATGNRSIFMFWLICTYFNNSVGSTQEKKNSFLSIYKYCLPFTKVILMFREWRGIFTAGKGVKRPVCRQGRVYAKYCSPSRHLCFLCSCGEKRLLMFSAVKNCFSNNFPIFKADHLISGKF